MKDEPIDPDTLDGCDVDMTTDTTSDDDLLLVVFTGGSPDMDVVEQKLAHYKELFPNGS